MRLLMYLFILFTSTPSHPTTHNQQSTHSPTRPSSITMPSTKCPYCNHISTAAKPVSLVNRHIKEKALLLSAKDRGNHPAKGTDEYKLVEQRRGFHTNAVTEEEVEKQKQKTAFRKR